MTRWNTPPDPVIVQLQAGLYAAEEVRLLADRVELEEVNPRRAKRIRDELDVWVLTHDLGSA